MRKFIKLAIFSFLLQGFMEGPSFKTPAQKQINEYTNKVRECSGIKDIKNDPEQKDNITNKIDNDNNTKYEVETNQSSSPSITNSDNIINKEKDTKLKKLEEAKINEKKEKFDRNKEDNNNKNTNNIKNNELVTNQKITQNHELIKSGKTLKNDKNKNLNNEKTVKINKNSTEKEINQKTKTQTNILDINKNVVKPLNRNNIRENEKKDIEIFKHNEEINDLDNPENKNKNALYMFKKHDIILGDKNSKVRVFEYSSPTCPHCSYFRKYIFPDIKKRYIDTKKIAYVIREFIGTKQDQDAVILAHCAEPDKFLKFLDVLYTQQDAWAFNSNYINLLFNIAKLGGVSEEKYKQCLRNTDLREALFVATREVTQHPEFVGTPTFFIGESIYKSSYSLEELSKNIDSEISKYKK